MVGCLSRLKRTGRLIFNNRRITLIIAYTKNAMRQQQDYNERMIKQKDEGDNKFSYFTSSMIISHSAWPSFLSSHPYAIPFSSQHHQH